MMAGLEAMLARLEPGDLERFTKGVNLVRTEGVMPVFSFNERLQAFQRDYKSLTAADCDQRWSQLINDAPQVTMYAVGGIQHLSGLIDRHLARRNLQQQNGFTPATVSTATNLDRVLFRAAQRQRQRTCCVIS